jgi:hypothetical protein
LVDKWWCSVGLASSSRDSAWWSEFRNSRCYYFNVKYCVEIMLNHFMIYIFFEKFIVTCFMSNNSYLNFINDEHILVLCTWDFQLEWYIYLTLFYDMPWIGSNRDPPYQVQHQSSLNQPTIGNLSDFILDNSNVTEYSALRKHQLY